MTATVAPEAPVSLARSFTLWSRIALRQRQAGIIGTVRGYSQRAEDPHSGADERDQKDGREGLDGGFSDLLAYVVREGGDDGDALLEGRDELGTQPRDSL